MTENLLKKRQDSKSRAVRSLPKSHLTIGVRFAFGSERSSACFIGDQVELPFLSFPARPDHLSYLAVQLFVAMVFATASSKSSSDSTRLHSFYQVTIDILDSARIREERIIKRKWNGNHFLPRWISTRAGPPPRHHLPSPRSLGSTTRSAQSKCGTCL